MEDVMLIEILPDGTVKLESPDKISQPNHAAADGFARELARLCGGTVTRSRLAKGRVHHHHGVRHGHKH